jgi:hypothetical protein
LNLRLEDIVIELLNGHRLMSISTKRPDGWPQTTLVGYVNDGFLLYRFGVRNSQKHANILRDPRVSIAIGSDVSDPHSIKALSLAERASSLHRAAPGWPSSHHGLARHSHCQD